MNKQQLANKIWESANKMRSKIEANEYKDFILGFMFYKYLSDKEMQFLLDKKYTEEYIKSLDENNTDSVSYISNKIGYFISYKNLFSTWLEMGSDFDVSNVTDALSAFSRLINPTHKKVFDGIFDTLQTGLSKLGDTSGARTKAISGLINLIKDIPMDGKQDYDVLGFIYEYLIGKFASNAGKKAGEFYTPHEVSLLMSEIVANHLKNRKSIEIYDPTSGSGSLLINIGKSSSKFIGNKNNIKYYAQELKENTYNLTRMNLVMRGIKPDNIAVRNGDTLEEDWPYFDDTHEYEPLYVDAVVSNPPYSQPWDPSNKETDPRYNRYGLAPKGKADFAFLLHDLFHIKPDGIMTIVLPHGVLFRGGEEGEIRKNLIENYNIDAIIGLPANIFYGTGIPTIIMVLKQKRQESGILIVDASKCFIKDSKNNKLRACDIKRIADTVNNRTEVEKFSRVVSIEEIRKNDYNLNIPRYVDSSEPADSWDIYASMFGGIPNSEISELSEYWSAFPDLLDDLFIDKDAKYLELKSDDIKSIININKNIESFKNDFNNSFSDFDEYLKQELIEKSETTDIDKEENIITDIIFSRLENVPLIDKYEAYQLLDDAWQIISGDLEIIQTEGFYATKIVDPNMVLKKKNGKEEEVQNGWKGHIIPFDLVQQTLLIEETSALKSKNDRLCEISSEFEEIIDSLSEEEKESELLNESGDSFINASITKIAKQYSKLKNLNEESFESKIIKVANLIAEEKVLKSVIKKDSAALHIKTKETIETLSDNEIKILLGKKWITPLTDNLSKLPDAIIKNITDKITHIMNKYTTTFSDIESEIKDTEKELCSMIDELVGNDEDMQGLCELKALLGGV